MNRIDNFPLYQDLYFYNYKLDDHRRQFFHSHQSMEFLYIHEGEGQVILENASYPLTPGSLVLFQPYQLHKVSIFDKADHPYVRTVITINPHTICEMLSIFPMYQTFFQHLWKGRLSNQLFTIKESHPFLTKLDEFNQIIEDSHYLHRKEEFLLFFLSFLQSVKPNILLSTAPPPNTRRDLSYSERIMEWIEQHYRSEIRLEDLASELHLSTYYISHLFRQETGNSITDYVSFRRMKEASLLLSSTELAIKEVAERVGIRNVAYFCRFFKKYSQLTPMQFREHYFGHYNRSAAD
jgi:AraC-like DNA-binding protein